jgi:WD40 repeat protein
MSNPMQVIGVQECTPIAWRMDGTAMAYVSGNHSIFVLEPDGGDPRSPTMRVATILNGHNNFVRTLVFHPRDNNVLVSGGADGIIVWSVKDARPIHTILSEANVSPEFPAHESDVEVLAFAFGNTLISGSKDSNIKLWDADRGYTLLETVTGHKASVLTLKVHEKSGRLASAGRDSTIKVWDISTLAPEWRSRRQEDRGIKCPFLGNLDGHRGDVVALTWRPDGGVVYSGARDNTWRVWNVASFSEVRVVEDASRGMGGSHRGDVRRIIGLPTGTETITASLDGSMILWRMDPEDGSTSLVAVSAIDSITGASVTDGEGESKEASGEAASEAVAGGGGWDAGTAAILEQIMGGGDRGPAEAGTVIGEAASSTDRILGQCSFFPPGVGIYAFELCPANMRLAISSTTNTVGIYQFYPDRRHLLGYDPDMPAHPGEDRSGRLRVPELQLFQGHSSAVHEIETLGDAEDRRLVTCSADNTVAVYDAATTRRLLAIDFTASALCVAVAHLSRGTVALVGGTDYVIRAYGTDPEAHNRIRAAHFDRLRAAGAPVMNEPPPGAFELARYEGHSGRVQTLAVHSNNSIMVSGAHDFNILLWKIHDAATATETGGSMRATVPVVTPLARVEAHMGHVTALAFCAKDMAGGNLLASGGNDHAVKVWEVQPGLMGGQNLVLKWTGGDAGDDGRFESHRGEEVVKTGPSPHRSTVSSVVWGKGPSKDCLFSAGWDHAVSVWSASAAGEGVMPLTTHRFHTARVTDIDTSTDGRFLITVSADFSARQWAASKELTPIARFPCTAQDGGMTSVAAGNKRFFTASENGQIRVFPLYTPEDPATASAFATVPDPVQDKGKPPSMVPVETQPAKYSSENPLGVAAKPLET